MIATCLTCGRAIFVWLPPRLFRCLAGRFAGILAEKVGWLLGLISEYDCSAEAGCSALVLPTQTAD